MRISVLGPEGVARLDAAARRIVERSGVLLPHEDASGLFERAGARTEWETIRAQ